MLRIMQTTQNGCLTIKLEGRLLSPWIDEVRRACSPKSRPRKGVLLDLSAVTFVDAPGTKLLRELMSQGVKIGAYSSFTEELLHWRHFDGQSSANRN